MFNVGANGGPLSQVQFDPVLIIAQICCLQCCFYLGLGAFLWLFVGTASAAVSAAGRGSSRALTAGGRLLSLGYFFDYRTLSISSLTGWGILLALLCNGVLGSFYLLIVVERPTKCLDFTATLFLFHLILCFFYGGIPSSLLWWIINGASLAAMTVLGEWLCVRKERQEMQPAEGGHSRLSRYDTSY
eukprot:TRINITY_DN748_c1_g1_i2.p1 TRINITY_DN748_c1_g1~~TRINITY_DN748_c1_g1_i2.p1  ORF type:complete len:187 (+),score=42.87 TRINITY_DN748_c1_g1_i2:462-1022(+)